MTFFGAREPQDAGLKARRYKPKSVPLRGGDDGLLVGKTREVADFVRNDGVFLRGEHKMQA
jgi:hypothetical protein